MGEYEENVARPILRYGEIDSLNGTTLISAKMRLVVNDYSFGDTTSNMAFDIYEVQKAISPTSTWDSIFEIYSDPEIYKTEVMGSFDGNLNNQDTLFVDINTQLIDNWRQFSAIEDELDSTDERRFYSYSIGLKPRENNGVINSFLAESPNNVGEDSPRPYIEVVYEREGERDTVRLTPNVVSYYANSPEPEENSLTVQSGVSIRSGLDFDVSEIPKFSSIVKATLRIYVDDDRSVVGSFGRDSLLSAVSNTDIDLPQTELGPAQYSARREEGTDYYLFPSITSAVESWVNEEGVGSLTFTYYRRGENFNIYALMDRYYLYGEDAPEGKKPVLTIFYSQRPDFE